ncbi:hypothetical protein [Neisseria leonii]|uniref:hypothetical protein n=1 Tax=Neisseria leonii TaxID=2995413 RepID=UPI00237AD816|nr:hypothetical protein [Neisseria sp. 3986]MDD9326205.1 SMP-30/gluconolactonase/LRE family protein [Neisseria sp. 3986]
MNTLFKRSLLVAMLGLIGVACTPVSQLDLTHTMQSATIDSAKSVENLRYITGVQAGEDLVQIPNSKWLIASGMAEKSGLHLIDSQSKIAQRWFAPKAASPSSQYPDSQPQPLPDEMQAHGISIREIGGGKSLLYVVNHNGKDGKITRETIEIFEVNANTATPTLTWLGNVRMPNDVAGNAVVSGADGSIFVTVMMHPQNSLDEMFAGKITGAVYRWTPKTRQFEKLQGSEFNGNNGIELSKDGQFIYVAHMKNLSKLTNSNPTQIVATTTLDYGVFDNLHWNGNVLITAGSQTKNCGKTMTADCLKDFHITEINPDNLAVKPLYQGKYNQVFSGVSTVLPVGKIYYLGSFYRDRLAYFETK